MDGLTFVLRPEVFCIHRLPPDATRHLAPLSSAAWYAITRTEHELSVVAPEAVDTGLGKRECGWSCLSVAGVLDFGEIGVMAGIAQVLASANVSLFAVSSYDTDHVLVRTADLQTAIDALTAAGHAVTQG